VGWSNQNVIATLVIIEGDDGGLYLYDPTAGAGNLRASVTGPDVAEDEFGNQVFPEITSYAPSGIQLVSLTGGEVAFADGSESGGWAEIGTFGIFAAGLGLTAPGLRVLTPSGDTSGAADWEVINTALTAPGVRQIVLGPGQWYIDAELTLISDLIFRGAGRDATVINQVTASTHGLYGNQLTNVTIRDLTISGPGDTAGTGDGIHLDSLSSGPNTGVVLAEVHIEDFGDDGLYLNTPVACSLRNVEAQNCAENGFHLLNGTSVAATGCYGNNCSANQWFVDNMQYSSFAGCAADFGDIGWLIQGSFACAFTGCGCETNTSYGWKLDDSCAAITLASCEMRANSTIACWVTGDSAQIAIIAFREVAPSGTPTASIQVDAGSAATVIEPSTVTATSYLGTVVQVLDGEINTDVWNTVTIPAEWTGSARVKLMAEQGLAVFDCAVTAPAAGATSGSFGTFPSAGYYPASQARTFPAGFTGTAAGTNARLNINTSGTGPSFAGLPAGFTGQLQMTCVYPVD
jgi:hypothetical protein